MNIDIWNDLITKLIQQKHIKGFSVSPIVDDDELPHPGVSKLLLICTMLSGVIKTCEFWSDEDLAEFLEDLGQL